MCRESMKKDKFLTELMNQNVRYANKKKIVYLISFLILIIQTNISEDFHLKIEQKRSPFALDVGFFDSKVKIDELMQLSGLHSNTRIKEKKDKGSIFVKQLKKFQKVNFAIKRFISNIAFRKLSSITKIHFALIDDKAYDEKDESENVYFL